MHTRSAFRRISALTLVVTLSLIAMPRPTSAASEEEGAGARHRGLTINGQPLSQLLNATVTTRGAFPLAGLLEQADGQISGVVVDATGQPVADQRVELRRPSSEGPLRLVTTTDTNGQFVYGRLGPGRYEVELRDEGRVIATSGPIELSEGAMRVSGVTVAFPPAPAQWRPLSTAAPDRLARTSADRLLGGQPVAESFETLPSILEPGHEVVVMDNEGRRTRGRVLSISRDQLVISRPRRLFFRPAQERAFAEGTVRRIEIVDSTKNGILIGAAVGAGLVVGVAFWEERTVPDGNLKGAWTFMAIISAIFYPFIGHGEDLRKNEPIYEQSLRTPQIALVPLLGRDQQGIVARVSF